MKKLLLVVLVAMIATPLYAQIDYSVNNFTRYGNGEQLVEGTNTQFLEYIENQTNLRLYLKNLTIGLQYQYDDPPEFGPNFQGIDERYVEFNQGGIDLRLGHFYTLYGKGLSMNLFEDRAINYDTKLDGFRGEYRGDWMTVSGATGTMVYYDLIDFTHKETYSVKSGHVEFEPADFMRIGGSIVGASGVIPSDITTDGTSLDNLVDAELKEGMISLSGFGIDAFASYVYKTSRARIPMGGTSYRSSERDGDGFYGSLIYTSDFGLGITYEYKNYRFDPREPSNRDRNRPTKALPFQNPPTAFREHSFYLLSRNPHTIDFNDEMGQQVDIFYSVNPEITLNLNASNASRVNSYVKDGRQWKIDKTNDIFASNASEFSPWYEIYGDVEWYFDGQSYLRFAMNKRYDAPYDAGVNHVQSSFTVPVRVEYMLNDINSIGLSLEQQWFHDSGISGKPDYYNQYIAITYAEAPLWTVTLRMEYTTDEALTSSTLVSGANFWRALEVSYRLAGIHTMTLSYGNERGGIVCSNGICRNVLPFNGVRFMILTQL